MGRSCENVRGGLWPIVGRRMGGQRKMSVQHGRVVNGNTLPGIEGQQIRVTDAILKGENGKDRQGPMTRLKDKGDPFMEVRKNMYSQRMTHINPLELPELGTDRVDKGLRARLVQAGKIPLRIGERHPSLQLILIARWAHWNWRQC